jgi:hypothetical protein
VIVVPPAAQSVTLGQAASFSVVTSATAPLTYQWQKNCAKIEGASLVTYVTPPTTAGDSGSRVAVVVTNGFGTVTSNPAMLTVNTAVAAPAIAAQPVSQTVTVGNTASFSVVATGTAPLNY